MTLSSIMRRKARGILKKLKRGGLVVENRGTAKSMALLMLAKEIGVTDCVVIVQNRTMASYHHDLWRSLYGAAPWPAFVAPDSIETWKRGRKPLKILLDEYFLSDYHGHFDYAVGTAPFKVQARQLKVNGL
jgi:hypothetical protein